MRQRPREGEFAGLLSSIRIPRFQPLSKRLPPAMLIDSPDGIELPRRRTLYGRDGMALTLHVFWHRERLLLWGERAGFGELARQAELRAAVGELSADALLASVALECRERLWLPCDEGGPIHCGAAETASAGGDGSLPLRPSPADHAVVGQRRNH